MGRTVTAQARRWKLAGASVIGRQHEQVGGRCEDAWASARRALPNGHEALAVCVSDGAGSAANGWAGAQMVSRVLANCLADDVDQLFSGDADDLKWLIVSTSKRVLRRAAARSGADLKSYACTLVAVLTTTDGRWLTVHLGDGGIVGLFDGELRAVSMPRKGEFANQTYFVTDNDATESIDIQTGEAGDPSAGACAFALFTDGVEGALVSRHTGEVSRVLADMFDWLVKNSEAEVATALEMNLSQVFRQRTGDDCSLAIAVLEAPMRDTSSATAVSITESDNASALAE